MDKESARRSKRREMRRAMGRKLLMDAIVSLPIAVLLMLFLNIYSNWKYTYGHGDDFTMKMVMRYHMGRTVKIHDEIMAVNISDDNMLVEYKRKGRGPGNKPIADRKKLTDFLTALKKHDAYRYVFVDLDFSNGYVTEYDDSLFRTISSMRDILVATTDPASDPEMIREKTAQVSYDIRKTGDDFLKYTFMDSESGEPSAALRMWQEMTGGTYEKTRWGYRMNGRRCYNSIIPDFKLIILDDLKHTEQERKDSILILGLGAEILPALQVFDEYIEAFDDKIVLIGDWLENDIHDTIIGPQPGTAIIYNAYLSLVNGDNIPSVWVMLLLTMILWGEIMFMLKDLFGIRSEKWKHRMNNLPLAVKVLLKLLSYIMVFITYAFPLKCFEVIVYMNSGIIINTLVLSLIFTILSEIISELKEIMQPKINTFAEC